MSKTSDDITLLTVIPSDSGENAVLWDSHTETATVYVKDKYAFDLYSSECMPLGFATDNELIYANVATKCIETCNLDEHCSLSSAIQYVAEFDYFVGELDYVIKKIESSDFNSPNFGIIIDVPMRSKMFYETDDDDYPRHPYLLIVRYKGAIYTTCLDPFAKLKLVRNKLICVSLCSNNEDRPSYNTRVFDLDYATEDDLFAKCIYGGQGNACPLQWHPLRHFSEIDSFNGRYLVQPYCSDSMPRLVQLSIVDLHSDSLEERFIDYVFERNDTPIYLNFGHNAVTIEANLKAYSLESLHEVPIIRIRPCMVRTNPKWYQYPIKSSSNHALALNCLNVYKPGCLWYHWISCNREILGRDYRKKQVEVLKIRKSRRRFRTCSLTDDHRYKIEDQGVDFVARARLWFGPISD